MKIEEQNFQKRLAIWPLLGTSIAAIGAILVTYGLSILLFGTQLKVDSVEVSNTTKQNLEILSTVAATNGWTITIIGTIILAGGPILTFFLIVNEKVKKKQKISQSGRLIVLFDEMYDGKDIELEKNGYDAYSVKKLRFAGEPLRYDHSVLKYVEENKMILVTEDPENYGGCQENNIPCIKLGQNPSIEEIINALESLKVDYDSKN